MTVTEKELPFDTSDMNRKKERFEPEFYDMILSPELMYKDISPVTIKNGIHNCFACDHSNYKKPLELSNFRASVMVIGETPSDIDFSTKEGKFLADTLNWAQFKLDDVYFTSMVKCGSSQTPERCQSHLIAEVLCVQPKLILALGYDVGKHFDSTINSPGHTSLIMQKYEMITTYGPSYTMTNNQFLQEYCNHMVRAKQRVDSI